MVPPEWQARKCEHAVVAWNHSQEASRAVAMTLPWLRQMQSVTVVVAKQREEQGKQLLEYLDLHGVSASHTVLNRGGLSAGERLLDLNREIGGDFLVAGGFSTPRSSQRLFGGVTSHLLRHSDVITTLVH